MIGPKGKFMLRPDEDRTHIFISSVRATRRSWR